MSSIPRIPDIGNQHVLITGGTGFVGTWIIRQLLERHPNLRITILDIQRPAAWKPPGKNVAFIKADITHRHHVMSSFEVAKPTAVIHTAGYITTGNSRHTPNKAIRDLTYDINVNGTKHVLEAAKTVGVKYLVYTSSFAVVIDDNTRDHPNVDENAPIGRANLIYGQTKTMAEQLVLASTSDSLRTAALRPAVIFGPGDYNFLPSLFKCIARNETSYIIGDATNLWDFVYVSNVADAHVLALENLITTGTAAGEAFFITNGEPVTFRDFCLAVWAGFGHVPRYQMTIPRAVAWTLGFVQEWVDWLTGNQGSVSRGSVIDATQTVYANINKARQILGYEPQVSLPEAVKISCQDILQKLDSDLERKKVSRWLTSSQV